MFRIFTTISLLITVLVSSNDKEYVVFETNVHDSLNIGVFGTGHIQRFKDSLQNISLMVSLNKKEQYSGLYMALKNPMDLSETSGKYLSFRIKGMQGNENIYIYLKDSFKEEGDYDFQVGKKIGDFSKITKEWKKVYIPLDSFPVKGEFYSPESSADALPVFGTFDWSEVNSITFSKADSLDYTFFLDDIMIVAKED